MNEKLNAEEQGHVEDVNLQNNLSAKYVVGLPYSDVDFSFTGHFSSFSAMLISSQD